VAFQVSFSIYQESHINEGNEESSGMRQKEQQRKQQNNMTAVKRKQG
jgi:hypothetical protein